MKSVRSSTAAIAARSAGASRSVCGRRSTKRTPPSTVTTVVTRLAKGRGRGEWDGCPGIGTLQAGQTLTNRIQDELAAMAQVELLVHVGHVIGNGLCGNRVISGDLFDNQPACAPYDDCAMFMTVGGTV